MNIDKLFKVLKQLEDKGQQISEVFDCMSFIDEEISTIWELIEEYYGLETSDYSTEILAEYGCGNLTMKQAQNKLKKLKVKID